MIAKQKSRPRKGRRAFKNERIFRRRRRRRSSVFALVGLAILAPFTLLATLLYAGPFSANDTPLTGVEAPFVADAPEPVTDLQAQPEEQAENRAAEREAAEQDAAEQELAREEPAEQATDEQEAVPPPPEDPTLYLTVPRLGIYGHTVRNDDSQWALDVGASKLPSTGFPWQDGANTYIAGHRIGWPGTESYYQFYNLPTMQPGDDVYLTDSNGTVYTYQVSEVFAVSPSDVWVTSPVEDRDVVSLQTCTETPNDWWTIGPRLFESGPESGRLIVQADKVAVDYA